MKTRIVIITLLSSIILSGCDTLGILSSDLEVNFKNPEVILKQASNKKSIGEEAASNLFQVDADGNVQPLFDTNIEVTVVEAFSYGLVVTLDNDDRFCVFLDNTSVKLPDGFHEALIGENMEGDLLFRDVSILRKGSTELESLTTTLDIPIAGDMSGNFVVIHGNNDTDIYQVFNTLSLERFNVKGCNGPGMVALSTSMALVNDCSSKALMDMTNGDRDSADIQGWNGDAQFLGTSEGAVVLSQGLGGEISVDDMGIGIIDTEGKLTMSCDEGFNTSFSGGSPLFIDDEYFVVQELNQVSYVKRDDQSKFVILDGYNVTRAALSNKKVYFIAEDKFGARVAGFHTLVDGVTTLLDTEEEFEAVFSF